MTLDIALITFLPDGIERVSRQNLPQIPGVKYIISWQSHDDYPIPEALLTRNDVEIYRYDGVGLSNNRNNAINHCAADVILFGDDDIKFDVSGIQQLIKIFEDNPELDCATFRSKHGNMSRFPENSVVLERKLPRGYSVASIEIAFRRSSGLRCCPELGLGSPYLHGGEDEMLLMSAIRRGMKCSYFPIIVSEHPIESTGTKSHVTPANLRASGCIIALSYGLSAILRVPLKAWRQWHAGRTGLFRALWYTTAGALMARGVLHRNHDTLW